MTRRPLWDRRRGLLAAALAVVVTNAAVFAHVGWNRAGGPAARLELTDREIRLPYYNPSPFADDEDTGLALHLDVQESAEAWLDRERLGELGFDVRTDPGAKGAPIRYRNVLPRDVWLVLELDGEAWRRHLAGLEEEVEETRRAVAAGEQEPPALEWAEGRLAHARWKGSRLFAVDAGLDRGALRERYPEPDRYAVVPGTARMWLVGKSKDEPAYLAGDVSPTVTRLQVPLRFRREVLRAGRAYSERETVSGGRYPRVFRAEVAFGRLGEPWLESVEALPVEAPASDSQTESDMPDGIDGESGEG